MMQSIAILKAYNDSIFVEWTKLFLFALSTASRDTDRTTEQVDYCDPECNEKNASSGTNNPTQDY